MRNDYHRAFRLNGSFDRAERPKIWSETSPRRDCRWRASGFDHRGSNVQRHVVPGTARHIREPKRPVPWQPAYEDDHGRSGANVHLHCGLAGKAPLGTALVRCHSAVLKKDLDKPVEKEAGQPRRFCSTKLRAIAIPLTLPGKHKRSSEGLARSQFGTRCQFLSDGNREVSKTADSIQIAVFTKSNFP
jgi:hypothetical protein